MFMTFICVVIYDVCLSMIRHLKTFLEIKPGWYHPDQSGILWPFVWGGFEPTVLFERWPSALDCICYYSSPDNCCLNFSFFYLFQEWFHNQSPGAPNRREWKTKTKLITHHKWKSQVLKPYITLLYGILLCGFWPTHVVRPSYQYLSVLEGT